MKLTFYNIIFFGFSIVFFGCASSGTLGGGPEDTQPPKLIINESSKQELTNYNGQEIKLVFDEYIELKNASKEIHVSPPLTYRLQTKVRGKTLSISLNEKEELKKDVTYIINMGQSIVDFRAGNVLSNFRYVFSTGDKIDSLSISGKVVSFLTNKPVENATVMLYNILEDSIVIKEKPYYLIKTDKEGNFKLENLKQDSFRIYAITDANNNYTYNSSSDGIGFISTDFFLDTLFKGVEIKLSEPNPPLRLLRTLEYPKSVQLVFSKDLEVIPEYKIVPEIKVWESISGDTLKLSYNSTIDSFIVQLNEIDTFTVFSDTSSLQGNFKLLPQTKTLRLGDSIIYGAGSPLLDIVSNEGISILKRVTPSMSDSILNDTTSLAEKPIANNLLTYQLSNNIKEGKIILSADWEPGRYDIVLPDSLFIDLYGRQNDTLKHVVNCVYEDELSTVNLKIQNLDSTKTYISEIKFSSDYIFQKVIENSDSIDFRFERLLPSSYEVKIIEDLNKNGIWDGPNVIGRLQPEPQIIKQFEAPKSNWEVEETIFWTLNNYN